MAVTVFTSCLKCFAAISTARPLLLLSLPAAIAQIMDEGEKLKSDKAKLKFENVKLKKGLIAHSPTTAPVQTTESSISDTRTPTEQTRQRQTVQKVGFALVGCQGNAKNQLVDLFLN